MTDPTDTQGQDHDGAQLIVGKDGEPFLTKKAATQSLAGKGLDVDEYTIVLFGETEEEGFAIAKRPEQEQERLPTPQTETTGTIAPKLDLNEAVEDEEKVKILPEKLPVPTAPEMPKMNFIDPTEVKGGFDKDGKVLPERYFWVRFDPKSSKNDQTRPSAGVNGEILTVGREVNVILPGRFVEAFEHAVIQQFIQKPGEERKSLGHVRAFPYRILGESNETEYLQMKAIGDAQVKALQDQTAAS